MQRWCGSTRIGLANNAEKWSYSTTGASSDSGGLEFDLSNPETDNKIPLIYGNDSGIFFNRAGGLIDQPSSIRIPGHGLNTGDVVEFNKTSGANIPQLTDGEDYHVIRVDNDTIRLAGDADEADKNQPMPLTRPTGGAVGTYQLTVNLLTTLSVQPERHPGDPVGRSPRCHHTPCGCSGWLVLINLGTSST